MKILRLKCSILSVLGSLLIFTSCKMGGALTDITKPYLGEYECKRAVLDTEDYLSYFDFVRLTLNANNTFTLSYQKRGGEKQEETGEYRYDDEKKEIVLSMQNNAAYQRRFPLVNGKITLTLSLGGKTFLAEFEQR